MGALFPSTLSEKCTIPVSRTHDTTGILVLPLLPPNNHYSYFCVYPILTDFFKSFSHMCLVLQAYELHIKRIVLAVLLWDLAFSTQFSVLEAHPCCCTKFCFIRLYCGVFHCVNIPQLVQPLQSGWLGGLLPGFTSVATLLECLLCDFSDVFQNIRLGPAFLGERICTSLPGNRK